jgi:hypothetical protein
MFEKNMAKSSRKLNLSDMGLGDQSMIVLDKILTANESFAQLDISKN